MTDDDPFERIDADTDREGDPFERIGRPEGDAADTHPGDDGPDCGGPDPTVDNAAPASVEDPDAASDLGPVDDPDSIDDPFAGVDAPAEDPFGDDGVFERVDVGAIDPDSVWREITADEEGADAESVAESRHVDVSKHAFCEGCEHFSPPPDVDCGHHTAEIVEFLDMETVRLLDCPVVEERRQLEREG